MQQRQPANSDKALGIVIILSMFVGTLLVGICCGVGISSFNSWIG